jgi:hypothetical protein
MLAPLAPLHGLGAALAARAAMPNVSPEAQQMREQAMEVLADAVGLPAWDATLAAAAYASLVAAGATAGEQAEAAVVLFSAAAAALETEEWCGVDSESMVRLLALYLLRHTIKLLHPCFMSQHALRAVAEAAFPPVSWIEVGPARSCFTPFVHQIRPQQGREFEPSTVPLLVVLVRWIARCVVLVNLYQPVGGACASQHCISSGTGHHSNGTRTAA